MRYRLHQDRFSGPAVFISKCNQPETMTIQPDGLEKNEDNEIYAHEGSFIDKDGKVITLTKGEGLEFSAEPVGILTEAVNLTDGPQGGSIMRDGVIYAEKLPYPEGVEYEESFKASIEAKFLGHIRCVGCKVPFSSLASGAGAAAAATVDLSKATGTLGIDKGGTGATSASEALSALLESQPLSVENGGTGATSASEALSALLESQPLSVENGGTGKGTASEALSALLESQPLSVENGGTGKGTASEALDALLESQPLPITKGGTGASDKDTAVTNLGAQKAAE